MDFFLGFSDWCWLGSKCRIDWPAWSAIGTMGAAFAAVFAAILTLTWEERRLRREALTAEAVRRATARRLALGIDQEIFLLGGTLTTILGVLADEEMDVLDRIVYFEHNMPTDGLEITSRFLGDLGVFQDEEAEKIMLAFCRFQQLVKRPSPDGLEHAPTWVLLKAIESLRSTLAVTIDVMTEARQVARSYHPSLAASFVDVSRSLEAEEEEGESAAR